MSDRKQQIEQILVQAIPSDHLVVEDESHRHNVPSGVQSHFKVTIVSDTFEGRPLVARHRAVYEAVSELLRNGVHAMAIHAYTAAEWRERNGVAPASPPCRGGGR